MADERSACDLRVYNIGKVARAGVDAMVEAYVAVQPSALSEVMALLQTASNVSVAKRRDEILEVNIFQAAITNPDKAMSTESNE